jgi:hypothetical protein
VTEIQARACRTILITVACFLLVAASALAQSGGPYDLSWNTVDGGGYTFSVGGTYTLGGTIGQADTRLMFGGGYSLAGGYWGRGLVPYQFYLPVLLRDGP